MRKVKVFNSARALRLEGLLLGVGLTLLLLGALGMVVPGPGFVPLGVRAGTVSWGGSVHHESGHYLQMLPSQYASTRLHVQEGGNASQIEVSVFSNYQALSPVNIRILLFQAINESDVSFILSWANATHDKPLPFTGFVLLITGFGPTQVVITYIIEYYGDFTYFMGFFMIALAALPIWCFIILAYLRRHRERKAEQKASMLSEDDPVWE
ncbi:MAG: hypothetical protein ACFFCF_12170 [Promethearchaeota archaeon]